MSTAIMTFDDMPDLPAELNEELDSISNLVPVERVPSLGIKGKVFAITLNNDTKKLMKKTEDGDEEPMSMIKVVVLGYANNRGRAFYEGTYDDSKPQMPLCWSDDGKVPSEHCNHKQAKTCESCPNSAKGSKVTDNGKEMAACQTFRMVALKPYTSGLDFEPLRCKLAITSDWDGQRDNKGGDVWYGFRNYVEMLKAHGVKHTAMVITKIKFDSETAYPKLLFSRGDWLKPPQIAGLIPEVKGEKVRDLISKTWTPNGTDGHHVDDTEQTEVETPAQKPKAPPPEDDGEINLDAVKPAAEKPAATKPADKKAAAAPAKEAAKPAAAAKKDAKPNGAATSAEKPKPEAQEVQGALGDLLSEWA